MTRTIKPKEKPPYLRDIGTLNARYSTVKSMVSGRSSIQLMDRTELENTG